MKITIIGINIKKSIDFDDVPVALKVSNGRTKYYHMKGATIHKTINSKAKRLIEALMRRN